MKPIKTIIAIICGIAAGRIVADPEFGTAAEIGGVIILIFCAGVLLFSVEQNQRNENHPPEGGEKKLTKMFKNGNQTPAHGNEKTASQMIMELQDKNAKLRLGLGKLLQLCKN